MSPYVVLRNNAFGELEEKQAIQVHDFVEDARREAEGLNADEPWQPERPAHEVFELAGPLHFRAAPIVAELTRRRVERGVTQDAVALSLGVTQATVSRWESGRRPIPLHRLSAYAALVGGEVTLIAREDA